MTEAPSFERLLRERSRPWSRRRTWRRAWRARCRASPSMPPRSSRLGSSRRCATRATGRVRPPRSWSGAAAGTALVLLRARRRATRGPRRLGGARDAAERTIHDLGRETRSCSAAADPPTGRRPRINVRDDSLQALRGVRLRLPATARRRGSDAARAENDSAAFAILYDRHSNVAFSLAFRMCGKRAIAEEVVQEAFLSALARRRAL